MPGHYGLHAAPLRAELAQALPRDVLRRLHRRTAWRHVAVAARQFALLGLGAWALVVLDHPAIWIPLAVVQGLVVFDFTVLLHEVVHHTVFARRRPLAERLLGFAYAVPSCLSPTQFTRWHLDHHAQLGSATSDPKRHHLSPAINARWYKLLYATPALFAIYFRAARRESATYAEPLRRLIARERRLAIAAHLASLSVIAAAWGPSAALRAYLVPVFVVFPMAFALNRLGQHYDIDPADPAQWTTLVQGHWFWDRVFLNSNYHLEHHYFPGVPFYRLPELQRRLAPFYRRRGITPRGYLGLLSGWILRNEAPHSRWRSAPAGPPPAG